MWETIMDLVTNNMGWIVTFVTSIGVLSTVIKKLSTAIKELGDVGIKIQEILADDKITNDEIDEFIIELKQAGEAFKGFWSSLVNVFKKKK